MYHKLDLIRKENGQTAVWPLPPIHTTMHQKISVCASRNIATAVGLSFALVRCLPNMLFVMFLVRFTTDLIDFANLILFLPYTNEISITETTELVPDDLVFDEGEFEMETAIPWEGGRTLQYQNGIP